ncbi:MAG: ribonuclease Z [Rikenellaceae bacterium]
MSFSITILGSSSAKPTVGRHPSSQVVNLCEQYYLVDAGEGCQRQMFRYGINPLKIRAVFISHLHGDHVYGLFPLLSTLGLYGRKTVLTIYAPRPFGEILESHLRFFDNQLSYPVEWHEVDTRKNQIIFENRTLEVWSIPLKHRVAASGYLFREKEPPLNVDKFKIEKYALSVAQITAAKRGEDVTIDSGETIANAELTYTPHCARSYAYLSDTSYREQAARQCEGVDLLYHEATYQGDEAEIASKRGHSTSIEAARAAIVAGAERLILGHFSARYRDLTPLLEEARGEFAESYLAEEGARFEIEKRR